MFLAALAHAYVFSYEEFKVEYLPSTRARRYVATLGRPCTVPTENRGRACRAVLRGRQHCCARCLKGTRDIFDIDVHKDVQFLAVATFSDVAQGMRHGVFQVCSRFFIFQVCNQVQSCKLYIVCFLSQRFGKELRQGSNVWPLEQEPFCTTVRLFQVKAKFRRSRTMMWSHRHPLTQMRTIPTMPLLDADSP